MTPGFQSLPFSTNQGRQMHQRLTRAGYQYQGSNAFGQHMYSYPGGGEVKFRETMDSYGPEGNGWAHGTLTVGPGLRTERLNGPDDPVLLAHLSELR
jgi:hypothetical protein